MSEVDRLLASLPDAVIGVRPDLTVFLWNGAAEALTGRSATRALERLLPECLGSEARLIRHLSETVRLAEFGSQLRFEDIPADVVQRAKDSIADTIATIIFGRGLPWRASAGRSMRSRCPLSWLTPCVGCRGARGRRCS